MSKKSLFTHLMSQSRVQNWNHQSSKNQIVNGVLDERFFNSNNLNKFQTLSCSTWKHSCSRSQWYICGQGKEWKTARVTKWQQLAFINLSNTQIHTELLDTLDGYTMHVHMEPKYLLIQNQTRSWARGKIISLKLVFLKFTSPIFPRDDNTLISHAPLKFLKRNCAIGGSPRQLTVDFSPFPDRDTLASLIFGTCWCTENYCDKKGKQILAFWNIYVISITGDKKVYVICSSFGDISGSHVFFVVSSLCGLFLLLREPPPLPLRWGVTLAGK